VVFKDGSLMPIQPLEINEPVIICHCEVFLEESSHTAIFNATIGDHPTEQCTIRAKNGVFECSRPIVSGTKSGELIESILSGRPNTQPLIDANLPHDSNVMYWPRTVRGILTLIDYCHTSKSEDREKIYRCILDHCTSHYLLSTELSDKIIKWNRGKRSATLLSPETITIRSNVAELCFQGVLHIQFYMPYATEEISVGDV